MLDVGIAYTLVLPISQYRPYPSIDQPQVTAIGPLGLEYLEKRKLFLFSPIGSKKLHEQAPRLPWCRQWSARASSSSCGSADRYHRLIDSAGRL
jgi:hypothetical protein